MDDGGAATESAFFRLPNGTTQLLANVASVLDAVGGAGCRSVWGCNSVCVCGVGPDPAPAPDPKGDAHATWYDDGRRRFINNCDIPSESDSDGDGGPPTDAGSDENGTAVNMGSVSAVVATAFTVVGELVTVASVGGRAEDILDVVESRDAREPGRNGEDVRGCGTAVGGAECGDGPGSPSGDIDEGDGNGDGDCCGCGCAEVEGSGSELGGGVDTSTLDGETITDVGSSDGSGDA